MKILKKNERKLSLNESGRSPRMELTFARKYFEDLEKIGITQDQRDVDVYFTDKCIVILPTKSNLNDDDINKIEMGLGAEIKVETTRERCLKLASELKSFANSLEDTE